MKDPSFWSDVVTRVLSTYAVVIFAMWWGGFIVAMVVNSYPALIRLLAFGGIVGWTVSLLCPASYEPCDRRLCSFAESRVERGHELE